MTGLGEWAPRSTLRPPPPSTATRDEAPTVPYGLDPWSPLSVDDEDVVTLVPTSSEIRGIRALLDEPDDTLVELRPCAPANDLERPVQATEEHESPSIQLDALVSMYGPRAERLARERAHALAIVKQAEEAHQASRERSRVRRHTSRAARIAALLERNVYTIIFSILCVWGMYLTLAR